MTILVTTGALMYFGAFDTDSLRSAECSFPPGVTCEDFTLTTDYEGLGYEAAAFELRNTYGADLNITAMTFSNPVQGDYDCRVDGGPALPPAYIWDQENVTRFECDVSAGDFRQGADYEGTLTINFTQANHTYEHYTKGVLFSIAQ